MIEILTSDEVAELLRIPSNKVILMARHGEIPFLMIDGRMRFEAADIEDWIKARKIGSTPAPLRTVNP